MNNPTDTKFLIVTIMVVVVSAIIGVLAWAFRKMDE
jgi:preprotein translocase subunit SecE